MITSLGMICLCIFLFICGLQEVTNITIAAMGIIKGLAALAAAILLALGRWRKES